VQGIDTDEVVPDLVELHPGQPQPFSYNFERQLPAGHGTGSAIADLSLADVAVHVADGDLEHVGPGLSLAARDLYTVLADFRHPHPREVGHDIGCDVRGGVVDFIEELLLAGGERDHPTRFGHLGHHE